MARALLERKLVAIEVDCGVRRRRGEVVEDQNRYFSANRDDSARSRSLRRRGWRQCPRHRRGTLCT